MFATTARALITIAALTMATFARAADIQVIAPGPTGTGAITVLGNITAEDGAAFERKTDALSGAYLVALESPGGNVLSALRIGERIRLRGWNAWVTRSCYSACALAWLGGAHRVMSPEAKVGFHAASVEGKETGAGNAIVGSYLTRLGYSYNAILFATSARPEAMSLLTPQKARDVGIPVVVIDPKTAAATPAPPGRADAPAAAPAPPVSPRPPG